MKTLILNPPCESGFERSGRWPSRTTGGSFQEPLFLAYAAAVLEKHNLDVELIDSRPDNLTLQDIRNKINSNIGAIVIQTSTPSIREDIETATVLKNENPDIKTVLVGPHPTVYDTEILKENPSIDIIARGEYDYSIKDISTAVKENDDFKKIKGITFRDGEDITRNPPRELIQNIDELPLPARHFLPLEKYFSPIFLDKPALRLISSRGCPFNCIFCCWPQVMYGQRVRKRHVQKVVDEIEILKNDFNVKEYYFDDSTFGVDNNHAISICNEIIKRKIDLPWICMGRVDRVNEKVLKKFSKARCRVIKFGVESASPKILEKTKKHITLEQILEAFQLAKKVGIKTFATIAFGLPGETSETIKKTIDFIIRLEPDFVQFSIATPYPGTEFFNLAKEKNWLIADDWIDFDPIGNSVIEYPDLNKKEIENAISTAYKRFYFRPKFVSNKIRKIKSLEEGRNLLMGCTSLVKTLYLKEKMPKNEV